MPIHSTHLINGKALCTAACSLFLKWLCVVETVKVGFIKDKNVHLDSEDCLIENIKIDDKDGMLRTKYKNNGITYMSISWVDNNVFFSLSADNLSCAVCFGLQYYRPLMLMTVLCLWICMLIL